MGGATLFLTYKYHVLVQSLVQVSWKFNVWKVARFLTKTIDDIIMILFNVKTNTRGFPSVRAYASDDLKQRGRGKMIENVDG